MSTTQTQFQIGMKLHFRGDFSNDPTDYVIERIDTRAAMLYVVKSDGKGHWIPESLPFTSRWLILAA